MFGPGRDQQLFVENLRRAVPDARELNARTARGSWWWGGTFRGRPVKVSLLGRHDFLSGVQYCAALGPLPIRMYVEGHYAHYSHAKVVTTGDAEFDRLYKVHGLPAEVVGAALDAPTRAWYLQTYGERSPQTTAEDAWLHVYRSYRKTFDSTVLPDHAVPTAEEIARFLEAAIGLSDRLTGAYESLRASIAQGQGAAAAERWHAAQLGVLRDAEQASKRRRLVIFGIVGLVFAVPLLLVLGFVLLVILSGCGGDGFSEAGEALDSGSGSLESTF